MMGKKKINLVNNHLLFIILLLQSLITLYCGKDKQVVQVDEDKQGVQVDEDGKLEFPENANTVVILGQSSHLDISWVYTSEEYYEKLVKDIFLSSIDFLKSHKNHIIFFAEIFWIDKFIKESEFQSEFLSLINEGKIKIEGGGVGTDDWVIIPAEGIIRNYMTGRNWLKKRALKIPKDAWVPDSFGFPPDMPDLLYFLGFRSVAFSRVNGFTQTPKHLSPITEKDFVEGSGGQKLFKTGILTRWKGRYGEVILFFMPNLYGIGSFFFCELDFPSNVYVNPEAECLGEEANEEIFSKKVLDYTGRMKHKANSKFIFIPIGWDFERPKKNLGRFVDYWNEKYFPSTGTFLVIGSFSDFISLVEKEKDKLPVFEGNLAPYWTGYFGSRTYLKRFINESIFRLMSVETMISIAQALNLKIPEEIEKELENLWFVMGAFTNHDSGAGTLYKSAEEKETKPLVKETQTKISNIERKVLDIFREKIGSDKKVIINPLGIERKGIPPFGYKIVGANEPIPNENLEEITDTEKFGFSIGSILWSDDGGSWRIGSETPPGRFEEISEYQITITKKISPEGIIFLEAGTETIPEGHSLTLRFNFQSKIIKILNESHTGLIEYTENEKIYKPTFTPFTNFFKVYLESGDIFTIATKGGKGVAQTSDKSVDVFVGRNTKFEKYDILGPLGDMSESGPFVTSFIIYKKTKSEDNEMDSAKAIYASIFPIYSAKGAKADSKTEIPESFSLLQADDNLGLYIYRIDGKYYLRLWKPSEKLIIKEGYFKNSEPVNLFGEKIKVSNTFELK